MNDTLKAEYAEFVKQHEKEVRSLCAELEAVKGERDDLAIRAATIDEALTNAIHLRQHAEAKLAGGEAVDVRHFNILAEAMAEVKATSDGLSDQSIAEIVAGCIEEINALTHHAPTHNDGSGEKFLKDCAICGAPHDNDVLSDICRDCEASAPWRDEAALSHTSGEVTERTRELVDVSRRVYDKLASETAAVTIIDQVDLGNALEALEAALRGDAS